jgi:hydroxyacylglutathione hydrolase
VFLHQRFVPGLAIYSYIVGDERTKSCAVIDPTRDAGYFVEVAKREGLQVTHILETHVHADFVSGSRELKARLDGEPIIACSGAGGPAWTPPYADVVLAEGDDITLGAVRLRAVHTPGHTPEHVAYALYDETRSRDVPWLLFSGDFVFVGDVGRPDLLGVEARRQLAHQLYQSVFETLPAFPDFTEILPGHGAGSLCGKAISSRNASTLGFERRFSAALARLEEDVWVRNLLDGMPIAPPYFRRMKKVNVEGPALVGFELPGRGRFSAAHVHAHVCDHCLIVDVRPKEAFASSHIPGAINIPLGDSLPTWAGWVLPYDRPTLLVLDDPADMPQVVTHLLRVGFDDVRGCLEGGMDSWQNAGFETARLDTMSVHDLARRMSGGEPPFVLDVRTEREWNLGHIDGAWHIHGGLLQERMAEVPRDREVAVVCGTGYRASIAASFLKREGYERVANVLGGMSAYQAAAPEAVVAKATCAV